jgi:hypothetical protein
MRASFIAIFKDSGAARLAAGGSQLSLASFGRFFKMLMLFVIRQNTRFLTELVETAQSPFK